MSYIPVLKRPLMIVAILTVAFDLLVLSLPFEASEIIVIMMAIALVASCLTTAFLCKISYKNQNAAKLKEPVCGLTLCLVFLTAFSFYATIVRYNVQVPAENFLREYADTDVVVDFTGEITEKQTGINYANYTIELSEPVKLKAKMLVFGSEFSDVGDFVKGSATVARPQSVTSRGFEEQRNLMADGIFVKLEAKSIPKPVGRRKQTPVEVLRTRVDREILRYVGNGNNLDIYALSKGLVMGDKSDIPADMSEDFKRCGISHILTVSGLHFSIIAAFLGLLLGKLKCPKALNAAIVICFCFGFMAFSGFGTPVIRSGIMAAMLGMATLLHRKTDGLTSLCAAAIIVCVVSPYSVFDVGAALSFLATAGILVSSGLSSVCARFAHKIFKCSKTGFVLAKSLGYIACAMVVSASACAFTLCITVPSFGKISTLSIVANLITGPVVTVMLLLLVVICTLSLVPLHICSVVCSVCGILVKLAAKYLSAVSKMLSDARFAEVAVPENTALLVILGVITGIIMLSTAFLPRKKLVAPSVCLVAIYVLCIGVSVFSATWEFARPKILVSYDNNGAYLSIRCPEDKRLENVTYTYVSAGAKNALHFSKFTDICDEITGKNVYVVAPRGDFLASRELRCITEFEEKYGISKLFLPERQNEQYEKLAEYLSEAEISFEYYSENQLIFSEFRLDFTPEDDGYNVLVSELDGSVATPKLLFCDTDRYGAHIAGKIRGVNGENISDMIVSDARIPIYIHSAKRQTKDFEGVLSQRQNVHIMKLKTEYGIAMESNLPKTEYFGKSGLSLWDYLQNTLEITPLR